MNNERLLKRYLKKKITFTQSLLVLFLITGGVSFASVDFNNYKSTFTEIYNPTLTEDSYISSFNEVSSEQEYIFKLDTEVDGQKVTKYYTINENIGSGILKAEERIDTNSLDLDIRNHFIGFTTSDNGGAISNSGNINGSITGDFISNYVDSTSGYSSSSGGAIRNSGNINGNITGDFFGNYVTTTHAEFSNSNGGAIYNGSKSSIGDITGNFIGNHALASSNGSGGAIYNSGDIGNIAGDFIGNYAFSSNAAQGGAIYNGSNSSIGDITGNFIGNYAHAESSPPSSPSQGGAIFNADSAELTLLAKEKDIEFTGNYTVSNSGDEVSNAIHNEGVINLLASSDKKIIFNDRITGDTEGIFNIGGTRLDDSTTYNGTIVLNENMSGFEGTVNFKDGIIELGDNMSTNKDGFVDFFAGHFIVNGTNSAMPILNAKNNKIDRFNTIHWDTKSELDMKIDINSNSEADIIENVNGLDINFSELNMVGTVDDIKTFVANTIKVADGTDGTDYSNLTLSDTQLEVSEGIYKYELTVNTDNLTTDGTLSFVAPEEETVPPTNPEEETVPPTNPEEETVPPTNPSVPGPTDYEDNVLQSTVALGGYASNIQNIARRVLNNTRKHEFRNSVWVDTFGAEENIKYSTAFGEKEFDNEIYSTTAGVDFEYDLFNGFEEKGTAYFGHYAGTQNYNSINIDQEGYYLGIGTELTKGNGYINLNAMYGMTKIEEVGAKYDANSLSLGIKVGEEHKVTDKIFIEPNFQFGYHMISAEDYKNNDGVTMSTDTLGIISLSQELKISYKGEGIKPYMTFSYNINEYIDGDITAAKGSTTTSLPMEVGSQSYFESTVGASKKFFNDNLNVYGEVIGTFNDNDSFGVQAGLEYKF